MLFAGSNGCVTVGVGTQTLAPKKAGESSSYSGVRLKHIVDAARSRKVMRDRGWCFVK